MLIRTRRAGVPLIPALAALTLAGAVLSGCPAEPPAKRREPPPEFRKRPARFAPGEQPPTPEPEPPEAAEPASAPASGPAAGPASRSAAERGLDPDLYSNPIAGFRIRKPKGWHFQPLDRDHDGRGEADADGALLRALKAVSIPPMVAFSKYQEPTPKLNPSVKVTYRPDAAPDQPLTRGLDEGLLLLKAAKAEMKITGKPTATKIAGHEAAQARVQYQVSTPSGNVPTELRLTAIRKGRGIFGVAMSAPSTGADRCEAELAAVLRSIELQ